MSTTLDMDGYLRMKARPPDGTAPFDEWLDRQGLHGCVDLITFGEGQARVRRLTLNDEGRPFVVGEGVEQCVARHEETIALSSPPPAFVFAYCGE